MSVINKNTVIYIGGDHASFDERSMLEKHLYNSGYEVLSMGSYNTEPANYAKYAILVANKVQENPGSVGIVMCGSGVGVNIAANKIPGIKCALVYSENGANNAREKNYNMIALGSRFMNYKKIQKIVDTYLTNSVLKNEDMKLQQYNDIDFTTKKDFCGTNNYNDSTDVLSKNTKKIDDLSSDDIQNSRIIKDN